MQKMIHKIVSDSLKEMFSECYSDVVLQKVATDRNDIIVSEVEDFIKERATKGISKSYIYKKYLVEHQKSEAPPKNSSTSCATSEPAKNDPISENEEAPDMFGLELGESVSKANLEGGSQDAN